MTITLSVLCLLLGIVVGAIAALALEAAAHRWRVMGMRELAAYRTTAAGSVGCEAMTSSRPGWSMPVRWRYAA